MKSEYIITMTAENRVGILAAVTKAMEELGAELLEASQTVVSGYFTMIFAAEFPEDRDRQVIEGHLLDVCRPFGITVTVTVRSEASQDNVQKPRTIKRLRLSGRNVPGILRKMSVKMSMDGIDIVGMHAFRDGESDFGIVMKVALPDSFDAERLPAELAELDSTWELKAVLDDYSDIAEFTTEQ